MTTETRRAVKRRTEPCKIHDHFVLQTTALFIDMLREKNAATPGLTLAATIDWLEVDLARYDAEHREGLRCKGLLRSSADEMGSGPTPAAG